ncbi:MAG: 3-phosphoglycerate dehydrogenase [Bacteroidetes bacterium]|nr:3-phosphoglycerate dehydrogenase [Bacteroidota bacterium]MBT5992563.1 3-phosphoglycerate dehydrogenase [Bacteroidota bacterium]
MKKVLIATEKPFAAVAVDGIRKVIEKAGYELILLEKYTDNAELLAAVADVDALIIRSDKVTPDVIEAGKNLKIVVRAGAGYDNVDLASATANNVCVMNTPGQNSNAVAELAVGMMVYMARGLFNGKAGTELKEKTIGIHAYGNVGKLVGHIAKGFGMSIAAFDPFVEKSVMEADGVKVYDSVEDLYKNCQYISLHIPSNDKTKESINYDLISMMPKGATIVNTARKEVVCEESLVKVMQERDDFKYLSDIAPNNVLELIEKFEGRVYSTPKKMGAQTEEANINAGIAAATQIVGFLESADTTFKVN